MAISRLLFAAFNLFDIAKLSLQWYSRIDSASVFLFFLSVSLQLVDFLEIWFHFISISICIIERCTSEDQHHSEKCRNEMLDLIEIYRLHAKHVELKIYLNRQRFFGRSLLKLQINSSPIQINSNIQRNWTFQLNIYIGCRVKTWQFLIWWQSVFLRFALCFNLNTAISRAFTAICSLRI